LFRWPEPDNVAVEVIPVSVCEILPEIGRMSVYFVYRSHYEGPSGKHVRRLDADSVLGWFQAVWERAKGAEDTSEWVKTELGCNVIRVRLDLRGGSG
jgi:hypothetical protein